MGRGAAFHRRPLADGARPGAATAVTPTSPNTIGAYEFPPFSPPELQPVRATSWTMIAARVLMVAWAVVTAIRIERAGDDPIAQSPSGTVTALGWVLVAAWFAAASRWSWLRTVNVHQLEGRYPTRARAAVVWLYPALWVLLMGVTLIPATPNPDFDYRPPIIVAGFLLTMLSGYRIIHRIFKSLVRMPPTATCVAFYVVDTAAFGLIWWRTSSWTGRDGIAPLDRDLDLGILVAASVALAAGAVVTWYLDRAADRAQEIRLLALRTRYDHRMARLNGLDPMNPGTRYALMLARRAAERAAHRPVDDRTKDTVADDDPLLAELAKELEHGITPEFAERVRELERRTDGLMPTRTTTAPPAEDVAPVDAEPGEPSPPRLWLAELLRYLVVGCYTACAVASVVLVIAYRSDDAETVDLVRRILLWGATGVHILVAAWAVRIAVDARRFGLPSLWRLPLAALVTAAVTITLWFAVGANGDAASIGLFTVLTLGLEFALWRITAIDWLVVYRESDSPLEAWMSVAPFVLGLVLLSPMRVEITADVSTGRIGFFATLIGLAAALSGGLAAVAMVQLEDALRASTPGERPDPLADRVIDPAPPPPAPIIQARATTVQTPTPKPRSTAPQQPLRVEMGDMSPEIAAGLGLGATRAPEPVAPPVPADPEPVTEPAPVEQVAKKTAAKKTPAAKKTTTEKTTAKKTTAKKTVATTNGEPGDEPAPDAGDPSAKQTAAKKTTAKKTAAKKTTAKKTAAKKTAATQAGASAPSDEGAFALDADADHGGGHQDPAEARHEREVAGDEVGRLGEDVDDADHGQQDHDVAQAGDGADESAGPGER